MLTLNCVNPVNPLFLVNPAQNYISLKYLNKSKKRGCINLIYDIASSRILLTGIIFPF
jgi:hypothetical protein